MDDRKIADLTVDEFIFIIRQEMQNTQHCVGTFLNKIKYEVQDGNIIM